MLIKKYNLFVESDKSYGSGEAYAKLGTIFNELDGYDKEVSLGHKYNRSSYSFKWSFDILNEKVNFIMEIYETKTDELKLSCQSFGDSLSRYNVYEIDTHTFKSDNVDDIVVKAKKYIDDLIEESERYIKLFDFLRIILKKKL